MTKKRETTVAKKRFYVKHSELSYAHVIYDRQNENKAVRDFSFQEKRDAQRVCDEFNRQPVGARVRLIGNTNCLGSSERNDLAHITEDRYCAGDEGTLAFPHPNQSASGCQGWWYVEVDSRTGEPRKLYVAVWPGAWEVVPGEVRS